MREGSTAEQDAVDQALEEACERNLCMRVSSLEKVLTIISWFSANHPSEGLLHRIREALTPRKDGYAVALIPASEALPAGRVMVSPGTADVNGRPAQCVGVVVSVRRAGRSSSGGVQRPDV